MHRLHITLRWLALCVSSTLFSGFLPGKIAHRPGKAGGTAGALVALGLQCALLDASWAIPAAITVGSFLVGVLAVGPAERFMVARWGPRKRHTGETVTSDFNETNIDEFHGQFLAGLPVWLVDAPPGHRVTALLIAFVVFRIFDTTKIWPVRQVETRFKGTAFGVMIDDTVAALPGALAAILILLIALR
ncbi:hypothetical protein EPO33_04550 [Patescibacteria group bacterium]|nr:MAG: hypothetical protein EPO33_04550 [Patescibacteria group bacterium]